MCGCVNEVTDIFVPGADRRLIEISNDLKEIKAVRVWRGKTQVYHGLDRRTGLLQWNISHYRILEVIETAIELREEFT